MCVCVCVFVARRAVNLFCLQLACVYTLGKDALGGKLVLEPCVAAVAAGDGRELWDFRPDGQLAHLVGDACVGVGRGNGTGPSLVTLQGCANAQNDRAAWDSQPNGQLRLRGSSLCLSQEGASARDLDVAVGAAVVASSTLDFATHGANLINDGSDATYWASGLDPADPVTLTLSLGGAVNLQAADVSWEFPAKDFSVALSTDGSRWSETFSTDLI